MGNEGSKPSKSSSRHAALEPSSSSSSTSASCGTGVDPSLTSDPSFISDHGIMKPRTFRQQISVDLKAGEVVFVDGGNTIDTGSSNGSSNVATPVPPPSRLSRSPDSRGSSHAPFSATTPPPSPPPSVDHYGSVRTSDEATKPLAKISVAPPDVLLRDHRNQPNHQQPPQRPQNRMLVEQRKRSRLFRRSDVIPEQVAPQLSVA